MILNMGIDKISKLDKVNIDDEFFYKIHDVDEMRPFFMSIVSDSNIWLFVASNGGISAGRKDAESAIFPYYTHDKIIDSAETTGSKSIFQVTINNQSFIWEPFSLLGEGRFNCTKNLYKNEFGNKVIFEEINHDLGLIFSYQWNSSNQFGIVKKSKLVNNNANEVQVKILDGLQNVLPYGIGSSLQSSVSNLADAYKRSELIAKSGLGIFALSAMIVDKAEPSEALKANVVWSLGLQNVSYLLSSLQLKNFRNNSSITQEEDIKGEKGAYFMVSHIILNPKAEKEWLMIANVNQTYSSIIQLNESINTHKNLYKAVIENINTGTENLLKLVYSADGLQHTANNLRDSRHFSNVLFNIMRGGILDCNYEIEKQDFKNYLRKANLKVFMEVEHLIQQLPDIFQLSKLKEIAQQSGNRSFIRLSTEYLPLKFSRRHGDPSRPWNKFTINTQSEIDGSKILDYEGNWRDIFQNWEALALSYPQFLEGMIFKFLNASTFDGYNPYRVTKDGFDWETIEPDNPWSHIGYWGDHQIIYLLKLLEQLENHEPNKIVNLLGMEFFAYANVPYKIKSYHDILSDPKNTIDFDHKADQKIKNLVAEIGADAALLADENGEVYHVSLLEKILASTLSKLSNFIPGGGIWMNTQRPEWNDANNALVGNGVSMVTLCYLRRFFKFIQAIIIKTENSEFSASVELKSFFVSIYTVFKNNQHLAISQPNNSHRKLIMDALGNAGSNFRNQIYKTGFSGAKESISSENLLAFIELTLSFLDNTIKLNRRTDNLYHSYNIVDYDNETAKIAQLSIMLEGQVAVLSSGYLSADESSELLDALKNSALYRHDQFSYLLYPNKTLPKFLEKNIIPENLLESSELLQKLINENNKSIIEKDIKDGTHFNGNFTKALDLNAALNLLPDDYKILVEREKQKVLEIFEQVFNHKAFTGRSGTMYAYEGLGSIYWHMVSKLLLAVQETCIAAISNDFDGEVSLKLINHYYEILEGIGVNKSPKLYGAFPTDPYSHTPYGKNAQQPGMTGQVKEDIICRFGELGVFVIDGKIAFKPILLRRNEFASKGKTIEYVNTKGSTQILNTPANALVFTYCQVPVIYQISNAEFIEIEYNDGSIQKVESTMLPENESKILFDRTGELKALRVFIEESSLRN